MNDAFGQVEQEWSKPKRLLMPEHILPARATTRVRPYVVSVPCSLFPIPCSLLLVTKRSLSLYLPILKFGKVC